MAKKLLALLVAALMVLGTMSITAFAETVDGFVVDETAKTVTISTTAGLMNLAAGTTYSNYTVILGADIDLAGKEWTPISFGGKFDGQNHKIKNLTINQPTIDYVGFITSVNSSFKNVTFENANVIGRENVGVIAGRAGGSNALVENVKVTGTIKVESTSDSYARAGVIVGGWAYGTYKDITVDGTDASVSYIKCTGTGDARYVAGIVGHADDVDAYINCTVKNITISGGWLCGGIAGPGPGSATASGCTVENIKMNADYSGGIFGWYYASSEGSGVIEDSTVKNIEFTDGDKKNGAIGGYSLDKNVVVKNITTENVVNAGENELLSYGASISDGTDTYYYVDLAHAASKAEEGDTITLLKNSEECVSIPEGVTIESNGFNYVSGTGTESDPFVISSLDALTSFRNEVNAGNSYEGKYIKLGADIDLSSISNWTPIGTETAPFSGSFDGGNHTVKNLNRFTSSSCAGLFGYIESSNVKVVIKNLTIENVEIYSTSSNVGAVAGTVWSNVTFENIKVTGTISIRGTYKVGGIVGDGYFTVKNSSVIGDGDGEITGEYSESDFEGDCVGGIAGFVGEGNSTRFENCSVSGVTITGTRKVGGIVGSAFQNNNITGCSVSNVTVGTNASSEYASSKASTMGIGGIVGLYNASGENNGVLTESTVSDITLDSGDVEEFVSAGYIAGGLRGSGSTVAAPVITVTNVSADGTNTGATSYYMLTFNTSTDGGFYENGNAAVVFNSFFEAYESAENTTYGFYLYKEGNATGKNVELASGLTLDDGWFNVIVNNIDAADADEVIVCKPYAINGTTITYGSTRTVKASVFNGKSLVE